MTRRRCTVSLGLIAALLMAGAAFAQPGRGPISGGSGCSGGVSGLTADDTISLCYDGTNWYETGRSAN